MCGLSFAYTYESSRIEGVALEESLTKLKHRGPDESGVWRSGNVSAGHVRLSIIDLENSRQPMTSNDDRYVLLFNGEIYNFQILKKDLDRKWNFRTSGDSEVLLAGLIIFGKDFISKLDGMWSFVFWDTHRQELVLSRDRTGKKPLYYIKHETGFYCSSEIPSLRALWGCNLIDDVDAISDYFRYGFVLPKNTFYSDVKEIESGTYSIWSAETNELTSNSYWKIPEKVYTGTYSSAKNKIRDLLIEGTQKRLVSDVNLGLFLSGGVDSSIIAGIVKKELSQDLETFTIGFDENSYDESRSAREVSEFYSLTNNLGLVKSLDVGLYESLQRSSLGQPFSDSSILPMHYLCQKASEKVKVALSGDGSDEVFCGYERYRARNIMRLYHALPSKIKNVLKALFGGLPDNYEHHSSSTLKKIKLFLLLYSRALEDKKYIAPTYFSDVEFNSCFPEIVDCGYSKKDFSEIKSSVFDIQDMMQMDMRVYLPQDIHVKVDRASMYNSLEVRCPFLDARLLDFAMSIPIEWKSSVRTGKVILKDAFSYLLPNNIIERKKQGFSVPIGIWFKGKLGEELREKLYNDKFICGKAVSQMLDEHIYHSKDHSFKLWIIYSYLVWRSNENSL